jgi:hypothetical protein
VLSIVDCFLNGLVGGPILMTSVDEEGAWLENLSKEIEVLEGGGERY